MSKPFWSEQLDFMELRNNFEFDCEHATTLEEALDTGANMVYLDGQRVGYINENWEYEYQEGFSDEDLKTEVWFDCIDEDLDGFYTAHYIRKEK